MGQDAYWGKSWRSEAEVASSLLVQPVAFLFLFFFLPKTGCFSRFYGLEKPTRLG